MSRALAATNIAASRRCRRRCLARVMERGWERKMAKKERFRRNVLCGDLRDEMSCALYMGWLKVKRARVRLRARQKGWRAPRRWKWKWASCCGRNEYIVSLFLLIRAGASAMPTQIPAFYHPLCVELITNMTPGIALSICLHNKENANETIYKTQYRWPLVVICNFSDAHCWLDAKCMALEARNCNAHWRIYTAGGECFAVLQLKVMWPA